MSIIDDIWQKLSVPVPRSAINSSEAWAPPVLPALTLGQELPRAVAQKRYKGMFRTRRLPFDTSFVLYIYRFPTYNIFNVIRSNAVLRECRGTVLSHGNVISRPFPVMPTLDWGIMLANTADDVDITIKINGTMVVPVVDTRGRIHCVDKIGNNVSLPRDTYHAIRRLAKRADLHNMTPIFEYVDPSKPLVLKEKPGCYLVGMRSLLTGRLASSDDLIKCANHFGLDCLTPVAVTEIVDKIDIEGVVIHDGINILRSKRPEFKLLQQITSKLRFNRRTNKTTRDLMDELDTEYIKRHLTERELKTIGLK